MSDDAAQPSAPPPAPQQPQPAAHVALVVFARLPRAGAVKTRLAAGVGAQAAAEFYRLCAQHAFAEVARCCAAAAGPAAVRGTVSCAAAADVDGVAAWLAECGTPMPVRAQLQEADLGRRMLAALTQAAAPASAAAAAAQPAPRQAGASDQPPPPPQQPPEPGGCRAAIVVGTDIPQLSAQVLARAAALLTDDAAPRGSQAGGGDAPRPDVVFGPAVDGGFYLLGFRTSALLRPDVQAGAAFAGVAWSAPDTLRRTAAACGALGLRVAPLDALPVLRDIDTLRDAREWVAQAGDEAARTPVGRLLQRLVGAPEPG